MKPYTTPALKPFFIKLTQKCFGELGLRDREIVEYVAFVLTNFSRTENLYCIRDSTGKRLDSIVEMFIELNSYFHQENRSSLFREMEIYQHIGDYTLFMTGIFKESPTKKLQILKGSFMKLAGCCLGSYPIIWSFM
ncbi:MAG: hypothetical protein AMJ42_06430 [Deltaproteobacteria bacterium DG_8]|nr:MAG: hypothetical protein AMJ42_06430 [Deltaproteobacteria bacterium DG_8]